MSIHLPEKKKTKEDELIKSIENLVESPERYDHFIGLWQDLINDQRNAEKLGSTQFQVINRAADRAIVALSNQDTSLKNSKRGPLALERIEEPAFLLNSDGTIADLNDLAWEAYRIDAGQSIHDVVLEFMEPTALRETLAGLDDMRAPRSTTTMARCFDPLTKTTSTAIFVRLYSEQVLESQLLMIVNTGRGAARSAKILTDGCNLTKTEHELLLAFLRGRTLVEIAKQRARSLPTIRNQMQSILNKTGCAGQSDLMRLSFSLSDLMASLLPVLDDAERTNTSSLTFLRPDGRIVDVTLNGARNGKLVISLPSIFGHFSTPKIEEKLTQAGVKMICIALPGMGKTDPAPTGMDQVECIADDIRAVTEQLKADEFILFGRASTSPLIFQLCAPLRDKISKAIVVNGVLPRMFVDEKKVAGLWAKSIMNAALTSTSVARLILRSGRRLMRMIGPKKFLSQMFAQSPSDLKILEDIQVLKSIEHGVQMVTAQGFDAGSHDMTFAFNDWSHAVKNCPLRVTLIQGVEDPNVPIESSRVFAEKFPDKCRLVEFSGGGLLNFSHPDEIIRELHKP